MKKEINKRRKKNPIIYKGGLDLESMHMAYVPSD